MSLTPPNPSRVRAPRSAWWLSAWIAGVFAVLVGGTLILGEVQARIQDPLKSPQLKELKDHLRQNPLDEATKQRIRALDLQLRERYFRQRSRMNSGVYLLLGGVGLFILSVTRVQALRKAPPIPGPKRDLTEAAPRGPMQNRWSVAASGGAIGVLLFLLSLGSVTPLPTGQAEAEKLPGSGGGPAAADAAAPEELARNWPRFRGANGGGVAVFTNLPTAWDAKTGAGIAWKIAAPAGFNSPLVWGERVLLASGNATLREVICFDLKTGHQVWRQSVARVPGSPAQPPEIPESTGWAAATMATDGRRVYAFFANGDLAAFTLAGEPVWSKAFGPVSNPYGHAASLATWQDRVILELDQGEAEAGRSKIYAVAGRTGDVLWQRPRRVGAAWATPIVIEAAGKAQIITLAVPWVIAYAAADGAELWRVDALTGEVTPSPIFAGGLIVAVSPSDKLLAIRPDGQGDVTKTHVAWTAEENVPDVTSPVSNGELVFSVTTSGMLTCFDAKDGRKQWEHDLEMEFHASPALAGDRLYLFSQKGAAIVVAAARQYQELFRTEMPDAFHASPAFAPERIVLRGVTNLWVVGGAAGAGGKVAEQK